MKSALGAGLPGTALLAELAATALAVERVFEPAASGSVALSRTGLKRALLALELRLKLEDEVLLPAWREARMSGTAEAAREIEVLRELAFELAHSSLGRRERGVRVASLDGIALLHFDSVARLAIAACEHGSFDPGQALAEIRVFQARWRAEIGATGSIEDESADPVGRPPR